MSPFVRVPVLRWHDDVPGSRWFRADLHVHTLDDAAGNATWRPPAGISGRPLDPATRKAYVRAFLKAAIAAEVEVVGLTPHSAHVTGDATVSVAWEIVEGWQREVDDDGVPFREKIYAVFPGFEPCVSDGSRGIHLLALFDSEIGKDDYLKAFTLATGGQEVWRDGKYHVSPLNAEEVFDQLRQLQKRTNGWDFLCIAPHAFGDNGLIQSLKGELLEFFEHESVVALELGDNQLPDDVFEKYSYVKAGMPKHRHCLLHSSDAYCLDPVVRANPVPRESEPRKKGIGFRHTFVKLAAPRIEAVRQAFLSADSRIRLAYIRDAGGALVYAANSPREPDLSRPWLRSVTVGPGVAFFCANRPQTFKFSPDLTCIIGGRMTGKSTLLDGLRVHCKAPMPSDERLVSDVRQRAQQFSVGDPAIDLDIVGPKATTLAPGERWPARFYTQRELQRIAEDQDSIRHILFRLMPGGVQALKKDLDVITQLDRKLQASATTIKAARSDLAEKEQSFSTADNAKNALKQFEDAGVGHLAVSQADVGRVSGFGQSVKEIANAVGALSASANAISVPNVESLPEEVVTPIRSDLVAAHRDLTAHLGGIQDAVARLARGAQGLEDRCRNRTEELRIATQAELVKKGRKAEDLNQFDALSKLASTHEAAKTALQDAKARLKSVEDEFSLDEAARAAKVAEHRAAIVATIEAVNATNKTVKVSLAPGARRDALDAWIKNLRDAGVTRWSNDRRDITDPSQVFAALRDDRLSAIGMSAAVASRFKELMTEDRRYELRALRSEDRYRVEAGVGDGQTFRPLEKLSGGKQVSVLLSLLLETEDNTPLVIDQPEDELDKAFLADTLLPILRRLKGKRQVILATHDANIVVNGDADQVLHLDGSKERGELQCQGAIDDQPVRHAVLTILDGGRDAFDLRRRKYKF